MKQSELDSMSLDELFMLHELLTATLEARITAERKALERLARRRAGPGTSESFEQTRAYRSGLQDRLPLFQVRALLRRIRSRDLRADCSAVLSRSRSCFNSCNWMTRLAALSAKIAMLG